MANVWMRLNCLKTPKCLLLCVCFQMPSITFPHRMTEAESTVAQRLLCTILILSGSNNNLQRPVNCPGEYLFVQTSVYQTITCILNEEAQWVEVYCSLRRSQVCSVRNFDTHTRTFMDVCVCECRLSLAKMFIDILLGTIYSWCLPFNNKTHFLPMSFCRMLKLFRNGKRCSFASIQLTFDIYIVRFLQRISNFSQTSKVYVSMQNIRKF